jgi:protein-tyrosine phosphatase
MDAAAARQVRLRGGDPAGFKARRLSGDLVESADLVLTATGEQSEYVGEMHSDAAGRTFVLGELGRLLPDVALDDLPPFADDPAAVYARGVALVAAADKIRGGQPPRPGDDLDDPWGRGDAYFARVADEIEATVRPLARALLS